ncbi:MAG: adenylosuccinate synthetase [Flavobacteriaceae bacterium]|nr:adenylosuccinate synthetase [Flavobacteriaceae bacterium]
MSMTVFFVSTILAQIPTDVPHPDDNSPIDFTKTADILIYIVLPVIILLLLLIRSRINKK